jgi:hypothetical protein
MSNPGPGKSDSVLNATEARGRVRAAQKPSRNKSACALFFEGAHGDIATLLGLPLGTVSRASGLPWRALRAICWDLQ